MEVQRLSNVFLNSKQPRDPSSALMLIHDARFPTIIRFRKKCEVKNVFTLRGEHEERCMPGGTENTSFESAWRAEYFATVPYFKTRHRKCIKTRRKYIYIHMDTYT